MTPIPKRDLRRWRKLISTGGVYGAYQEMLGRAVEQNPNLANDAQVFEYCEAIDQRLATSIGFDPNYQTHLDIVFNKQGLHFTGGWIDEMFANAAPPTKGA